MKVMILAAGLGKRLLPITQHIPKPLVEIQGKPVIVRLIKQLADAGFKELIINVSYLAEKIQHALGNGRQFKVNITYSFEAEPLETGGGIVKALPLLGEKPFLAINSDIITDFPFAQLKRLFQHPAHLVLIEKNPDCEQQSGDFGLDNGLIVSKGRTLYTYSGIAVYDPVFFTGLVVEKFSVVSLLKTAIDKQQVSGELYSGLWHDIGHIQNLQKLQQVSI